MTKYTLTLVGVSIAIAVLLFTKLTGFELFEAVVDFFVEIEHYELDEFVIPLGIVLVFALFDQARMRRSHRVEREKIKIYKAMLSSTHHILNNFLNQMLLVKLAAKETPGFDPKVLALYEQIVGDASTQIEALGSITRIDEVSIHKSVEPRPVD